MLLLCVCVCVRVCVYVCVYVCVCACVCVPPLVTREREVAVKFQHSEIVPRYSMIVLVNMKASFQWHYFLTELVCLKYPIE